MTAPSPPTVGDELPPLRRLLRPGDLVAYAGATWDWHRLHHDQQYAAARGLRAPIVDGQLLGALLAEHVQDHFGPRARVTRMEFRFAAMVFAGEAVEVTGRVAEVDVEATMTVTVEQLVTASSGRVAIEGARTTIEVPA